MQKYSNVPCAYCGQVFPQRRPDNHYCGQSCYHSARWGKPITVEAESVQVDITCQQCGVVFRDWLSQRRLYCSNVCRGLAGQNRRDYTCLQCGKAFQRPASVRNVHWCSRQCYYDFRSDPATFQARFLARVDRTDETGCWPFMGPRLTNGYGYFGKPKQLAHRLAWQFSRGETIPDGLVIMHLCDNRACCRPDHLKVSSQRENLADMVRKGRDVKSRRGKARQPITRLVQLSMLI